MEGLQSCRAWHAVVAPSLRADPPARVLTLPEDARRGELEADGARSGFVRRSTGTCWFPCTDVGEPPVVVNCVRGRVRLSFFFDVLFLFLGCLCSYVMASVQ